MAEMLHSNRTARKVKASAFGAGVGVAASQVLIYVIETISNRDIPGSIEDAAAVIVTALLAWAAGFWASPHKRDQIRF